MSSDFQTNYFTIFVFDCLLSRAGLIKAPRIIWENWGKNRVGKITMGAWGRLFLFVFVLAFYFHSPAAIVEASLEPNSRCLIQPLIDSVELTDNGRGVVRQVPGSWDKISKFAEKMKDLGYRLPRKSTPEKNYKTYLQSYGLIYHWKKDGIFADSHYAYVMFGIRQLNDRGGSELVFEGRSLGSPAIKSSREEAINAVLLSVAEQVPPCD